MAERVSLAEPDQFAGAPHPREQALLFGHDDAEATFLEAWRSGKLHHAWLVGGAQGIGKATFAYRAARFLLKHPDPNAAGAQQLNSLFVAPDDRVFRQVAGSAHPDVAVIRRGLRKDGKGYSAEIAVADVRRALDVFASTADGYRICIVDCADDLNAAGANALLKAIEEPPPRSIVFVISHAPARTLPTIRSRCRRLGMRPLSPANVARAVEALGAPWSAMGPDAIAEVADISHGSVGRALTLLDEDRMALVRQTRALLGQLPQRDLAAVVALAEKVAGRDRADDLQAVLETIEDWTAESVRSKAMLGARRLAPLVEVWEKNAHAAREADAYNLDKRPLVISMFGDLAEAVRRVAAD